MHQLLNEAEDIRFPENAFAIRAHYTEALATALSSANITVQGATIGMPIIIARFGGPERETQHPRGVILKMGAYSYSNGFNDYMSATTVQIGRYCSIAAGSSRMDIRHPTNWVSTHPFAYSKARYLADGYHKLEYDNVGAGVKIGNDVWIGAHVLISENVTIGDGAIISARSVVTKNVDPYSIVGGVPARLIKKRFPKDIVERLLASQWWDYDFKDFPGEVINRPEKLPEFIEAANLEVMSDTSTDPTPYL